MRILAAVDSPKFSWATCYVSLANSVCISYNLVMSAYITKAEALTLLATGEWEYGVDTSFMGRAWIQKGGVGKGGETRDIRVSTHHALRRGGYIKPGPYHFPVMKFEILKVA